MKQYYNTPLVQKALPIARKQVAGNVSQEASIRNYRKLTGVKYAEARHILRIAVAAVAMGDL